MLYATDVKSPHWDAALVRRLGDVVIAVQERNEILIACREVRENADALLATRAVVDRLRGKNWTWPWHEVWQDRFTKRRRQPRLWHELRGQRQFWASESVPDIRPELLVHTVAMTAATRQALSLAAIAETSERLWPWLILSGDCRIERAVARLHWSAIRRGDLRALPPFFPGDRSGIMFLSAQRREHLAVTGVLGLAPFHPNEAVPLAPRDIGDALDGRFGAPSEAA